MSHFLPTLIFTSLTLVAYVLARMTYNVFYHPLSTFPGDAFFCATGLTKAYHMIAGDLQLKVKGMHDKYGSVVRIAPTELSFSYGSAWKDIYGSRGGRELSKFYDFYRVDEAMPQHIISAGKAKHSILRRYLAHGFSENSMKAQEPVILDLVNLLMQRLREHAEEGARVVDVNKWFNFATFDIIGKLTFGADLRNLRNRDWHPWVKGSANNNKVVGFMAAANSVGLGPIIKWCISNEILLRQKYLDELAEMVQKRTGVTVERPDFIQGLLREDVQLSNGEIVANVEALIGAGSESTATLLTGTVCALLQNPDQLAKVIDEVRSTFRTEDEITLHSVQRLDYILACLNETFRYYPPVTNGMPRVTPKEGAIIGGRLVPGNTVVAIWQWAICHDPALWKDPYTFRPERFLEAPEFSTDVREALNPFSVGTRNCIGRNLSYAETRLILARLFYHFDLELADPDQDWFGAEKAYLVWDSPALNMYLKPVVR